MDPTMLSRMGPEKREEMKDMYHKMQTQQTQHLKFDVHEDDISNVTPEQMMMGMTGASSTPSVQIPEATGCPVLHS